MRFLKKLLIKAVIWFVITIMLVILDTKLLISESYSLFPFVGILLPLVCAIFFPVEKKKPVLNSISNQKKEKIRKIAGEIDLISDDVEKRSVASNLAPQSENLSTSFFTQIQQINNSEFNPSPVSVPKIFTEKEYASNLIDNAKEYATKINTSTSVVDFVVAYNMIKQTLEKLAWLNEEKHVFMYPTPRHDFLKMYDNMENTINDFIFRSMGRLKKSGGEWEAELSALFDEMNKNPCFSALMTDSNREQIRQIRHQLESNLQHDQLTNRPQQDHQQDDKDILGENLHKSNAQLPEFYEQAIDQIFRYHQASASLLQRNLKISFQNACAILDYFESCGIVGNFDGSFPRKILVKSADLAKIAIKKQDTHTTQIDVDQILKDESAWRRAQMGQSPVEAELARIDKMDGHTFEQWCARLLEAAGFTDVEVTKKSGDQGVDVLATMEGGVRYAVQCKCYSSDLGNKPIQEVYAGITIYNCQIGCVMTNRSFTAGAKELAEATGVSLWDRVWITSLLEELDTDAFPL